MKGGGNLNSNLIKSKIILNGLNQNELAKLVGMNPSTLSQKLNMKSEFTRNEMEEIAKVLKSDVKELFFCLEE